MSGKTLSLHCAGHIPVETLMHIIAATIPMLPGTIRYLISWASKIGPKELHVSTVLKQIACIDMYSPTCAPPMYKKNAYALKIQPMFDSEYPCN